MLPAFVHGHALAFGLIRPLGPQNTFVSALHLHLRALTLYRDSAPPASLSSNLLFLTSHLLALVLLCRLAHWPLWLAPLLLAGFCLPQLALRRWFIEALAPLVVVYGLAGLRLFIVYGLQREVPTALSYGSALAVSAVWIGLIYLRAVRRLRDAWIGLAIAASALMVCRLWTNLPAGVTGSDPFAYVQMGLDLAQRGTPRHLFPLAPFAARLGLPTLPTTHVGYVLPNAEGFAPTVWPSGYSLLLAIAYRVGGERGMLSLNVWVGLANLILTLGLTILMCPARWRRLAVGAGMGAMAVAASSPEQFSRLVVPLADGAALMFTAMAVGEVLYAARKGVQLNAPAVWGGLCGLTLAAAYSVRYTQALVGPGIMLTAWSGIREAKRRRAFLLAFVLAAIAGAAPDAAYRTQLYGAPWRFGTGELASFAWQALPEALARLSSELFSLREFGWLWPLALVGAVYVWRRNRFVSLVLAGIYGPLFIFHLWYPFLRLRDLLSIYPPLAASCAIGAAVVVITLWRRGAAARLLVIAGLFALIGLRLSPMLELRDGFFTFGYLRAEQRQDIESLAGATEPNAVIACSLNSGAVELYGERETARPGNLLQPGLGWGTEQWLSFVAALRDQGRPLYLLMDSPEMDAPLEAVRSRYGVTLVAELNVPVYFVGGGSVNLTVPLYRLAP